MACSWRQAGAPCAAEGNRIGTDLTGLFGNPNEAGVVVFADDVTVGGAGARGNLISANDTEGVLILGAQRTRVSGNSIGVDAELHALGNETGIAALGASGGATIDGNVVAGNLTDGIELGDASSHAVVQGNWIGEAPGAMTGTLGNGWSGVYIEGAVNTVGGTAPGEANEIRSNGWGLPGEPRNGVRISGIAAQRNSVRGNVFHFNAGAAIALVDGANGDQPAPAFRAASRGSDAWVAGTARGPANTTVIVDFYNETSCGSPEAFGHLGGRPVAIGPSGKGSFSEPLPNPGTLRAVTATVTSADGNTSPLGCVAAPLSREVFSWPFGPVTVREDAGVVTIGIRRQKIASPPLGPASVGFSIAPGSADPSDFEPVAGRVAFAEGETEKTISVRIVDDRRRELTESFSVVLSDARGTATLAGGASRPVSIERNDLPPAARIGAPRRNTRAAALKRIRGSVTDPDDDTARVEIALVRLPAGARAAAPRCQRLTRSGKLASTPATRGRCRPRMFLRAATAGGRWSYRLRRRLPAGRYVLYARGIDEERHVQSKFSSRGGNRVAFRLR